jgi:hypothetical protein
MRPLGRRQSEVLAEAAREVCFACPWLPIGSDRRQVESLTTRGLLGSTENLFGITAAGCLAVRHHDRDLAGRALIGLRRNRDAGEAIPSSDWPGFQL